MVQHRYLILEQHVQRLDDEGLGVAPAYVGVFDALQHVEDGAQPHRDHLDLTAGRRQDLDHLAAQVVPAGSFASTLAEARRSRLDSRSMMSGMVAVPPGRRTLVYLP